MSRHERQRAQILLAESQGQYARVLVLSREHLAEFPGDSQVRAAAESAARHIDDDRRSSAANPDAER